MTVPAQRRRDALSWHPSPSPGPRALESAFQDSRLLHGHGVQVGPSPRPGRSASVTGVWAGHVTQDSQSEPTHPTGAAGPSPTQTKQDQSVLKALNWFSVTCNQRSLKSSTCSSFIVAVSKPSRFWRDKAGERNSTGLTGKASGSLSPSGGPQWQLRDPRTPTEEPTASSLGSAARNLPKEPKYRTRFRKQDR